MLAYKKDIYASTGTTVVCGLILLLMLWLRLVMPSKIEEQGIEVGYGVDLEGEVGGSQGGTRGNFAGDLDGSFDAKRIDVPSFSEKPVIAKTTSQTSNTQINTNISDDDFATQDNELDVVATTGGKVDKKADEEAERFRVQQESERQRIAAEQKAKADKARALGAGAFGNSGGTGSGGFGTGSGTGTGSGSGQGTGIGDGVGSGTRGNPLGSGTSNGNTWTLAGRGLNGSISRPPYNQNIEGKITVIIRVDEHGIVTDANFGTPTTIADETLLNATLQSARKTKFTSGNGTAFGKIEYNFKLN